MKELRGRTFRVNVQLPRKQMPQRTIEKLAEKIAAMPRRRLVTLLRSMDCAFTIDFTDKFLKSASLERLRHIALAAALHAHNTSDLSV